MKDWSSKLRTFDVEKPRLFSAPTVPTGTFEERKGYIVRTRGDTEGMIKHEYVCPLHGKFEAMVERAYVPDVISCPLESWSINDDDVEYPTREAAEDHVRDVMKAGLDEVMLVMSKCHADAPWAGAAMGIGVSAGEVSS